MRLIAHSALAGLLLWAASAGAAGPWHVFHHENVLGTSLELKVATASASDANKAEAAALREIDRLAGILSSYDARSEFSRWNRTQDDPVRISTELFEVLGLFDQWRDRTSGALDAAAEAVCQLWKGAGARKQVPTPEEISAAVAAVHTPHWRLDPLNRTATRLGASPLILNSLTKSYIVSRAADAARLAAPVDGVVVNIGADIVVRGAVTESVEIADPRSDAENGDRLARVHLRNRAMATSGGYRRGTEIGGRFYSHIVDPRTGQPVDHILSATVVAANAAEAGAMATAFCVMSPDESLRLAATRPQVECLLLTQDGRRLTSRGWSQLELAPIEIAAVGPVPGLLAAIPAVDRLADGAAGLWDSTFELAISIELSTLDGQRAKRPYVAVWIEDKDKYPVRTVALWFQKPRWLPDLSAWSHSDQLRALADNTEIASSVSSATRSPGKYTLRWDGKDDKGHLVKAGRYTVMIEAAREHGTHQLIRKELDFTGTPAKVDLSPNVEIAAASLEYRKKLADR